MQCGGMLPWLGWKAFWFSTVTSPGNGGPLLQPQGQRSVFYKVPPGRPTSTGSTTKSTSTDVDDDTA